MTDEREYPMSASVLGRKFGANGQEMNALLAEQGYLAGEPGAYRPTEKGEAFASTEDHFRGSAGSSVYSASWETRKWDPSIAIQLDISRDDVLRVGAELSERRREKAAQSKAEGEAYWSVIHAGGTAAAATAAAAAITVPISAYGADAESGKGEGSDFSNGQNVELEPELDGRVVAILLGGIAVLLGGLWVAGKAKQAWAARKARKEQAALRSTEATVTDSDD